MRCTCLRCSLQIRSDHRIIGTLSWSFTYRIWKHAHRARLLNYKAVVDCRVCAAPCSSGRTRPAHAREHSYNTCLADGNDRSSQMAREREWAPKKDVVVSERIQMMDAKQLPCCRDAAVGIFCGTMLACSTWCLTHIEDDCQRNGGSKKEESQANKLPTAPSQNPHPAAVSQSLSSERNLCHGVSNLSFCWGSAPLHYLEAREGQPPSRSVLACFAI